MLRHIKNALFSFDPLKKESVPCRLLLSMMKSKEFLNNNPSFLVNVSLKPSIDPIVTVTFSIII